MTFAEIWSFLVAQVQTNQFLTGATITGALMGIVYTCKSWLFRAYAMVKGFFRISLTIHSEDALYIPVSTWLYAHNFDRFARTYRVRYVDNKPTYGPAEGSFLFLYKGQLIRVTITKDSATNASSWRSQTREYLTISYYSFKRSREILNGIVKEAIADYVRCDEGVPVYASEGGSYNLVTRINKRKVPSVVLPQGELERIEEDIQAFIDRKDWYLDRGVPYHRGYLLTGPPGTGKTSLVRHLGQRFGMPVYVSDGTIRSITCAPPRSILLLEDVDSITKMRDAAKDFSRYATSAGSTPGKAEGSKSESMEEIFAPSLSSLLNALDGIASTDGVIVVMTTNCPEKLDPAVLRPGRVDYRLHLGPCSLEQGIRMFTKFYGDERVRQFAAVLPVGVYTPAQLQDTFIVSETAEEAIDRLALALVEERAA